MFYNHAEETEKRRQYAKAGLGRPGISLAEVDSGGGSGASGGLQGTSRSHRRTTSAGTLSSETSPPAHRPNAAGWDAGTTASNASEGTTASSKSLKRPAWPPSHAEIVAGARSEVNEDTEIVTGPKIPVWYRGPLLLSGKLELPQPPGGAGGGSGSSAASGYSDDAVRVSRRSRSAKAYQSESGIVPARELSVATTSMGQSERGPFVTRLRHNSSSSLVSHEDVGASPEMMVASEDDIRVGVGGGRRRRRRKGGRLFGMGSDAGSAEVWVCDVCYLLFVPFVIQMDLFCQTGVEGSAAPDRVNQLLSHGILQGTPLRCDGITVSKEVGIDTTNSTAVQYRS